MQGRTTDRTSDSAAASNGIRIDGVLLLTGTLGLGFLFVSWACAFYVPLLAALGAYFAIVGQRFSVEIAAFMIISALIWGVTRWIARGLLEGRKAPAIVACILMTGLASFSGYAVIREGPAKASVFIAHALIWLLLSLLLIASFRNRLYWGRAR
jgi:hypothetical protein